MGANIEHRTSNIQHRGAEGRALWRRRRRTAFTLQELIVVLVSVVIVAGMVFLLRPKPSHGESAWRIKCSSNLRQIGQAVRLYAIDHGTLPRTRHDSSNPAPVFYTNPLATDPFGPDGPEPNDVTAAWFLLLRETDLQAESFLCPLTEHDGPLEYAKYTGRNDKRSMSNFPDRRYIGYSFANPYAGTEVADWDWSGGRSSTFPLAADINPGVPELLALPVTADAKTMRTGNSPNHGQEGQNVLYADGSVRHVTTPFEGTRRDNIYTAGGPPPEGAAVGAMAIVSRPLTLDDSVLLPVATGDPVRVRPSPAESRRRFWIWIGFPGVVLGGLLIGLVVIYANRARRRMLERGELPEIGPR